VTYGAVVNACCSAGDVQLARRVMEEMRAAKFMPDATEYGNVVRSRVREWVD